MRIILSVGAATLALAATACGATQPAGIVETTGLPIDPAQRAVRIETTGCGYASGRTGSGVAIEDGLVLTVAHLVVQADHIAASIGGGRVETGAVVAVDLERDLAFLEFPTKGLPMIEMSSAGTGAQGLIVGAATSGTVPFEVRRVVSLTIEEILGTDRHSRGGYELRAATTTGDSGAGAYDEAGRLIGMVFATGQAGESTWITASSEVGEFLASRVAAGPPIVCDPETSRLDLP